ncbi:MAG TPA: ice-binding family protein [Candidatus Dormibacteraeota bacterium]|nr:ice-binding family protein [Candidatus Dormibacteraeota bacterium]
MKRTPRYILSVAFSAVIVGANSIAALAATQPRMGTAANFAVLAGSTITNTGPTVISGGLGLSPGSAVTGFPPGVATVQHKTDAVALAAKNSLVTAYNDLASWGATRSMTGQDLGGKTLTPGVYTFSSSAQLTGTLTLSGNGIYIFQMGSTLTTASNSQVLVTRGAQGCGVYWKVGSSATLGSGTQFKGTVIALTSITMVTGASIIPGRALARNGAVTLDSNRISMPIGGCSATSAVAGPPNGGAGPLQGDGFPWILAMVLGVVAGVGAVGLGVTIRGHHSST